MWLAGLSVLERKVWRLRKGNAANACDGLRNGMTTKACDGLGKGMTIMGCGGLKLVLQQKLWRIGEWYRHRI
jgi:hypothetical protein